MFIPLGYHCNVTFLSQELQIKKETGLFEWLESRKLQYITDIINVIKENINTDIIKNVDKYVYVLNELVYTYHYDINDYKVIFERRAKRFLDIIKNSSQLFFVRINPLDTYTSEEEINNFSEAIHSINSNIKMKFLLIHTIKDINSYKNLDEKRINTIELVQKCFLYEDCIKDGRDEYLHHNDPIRNLFKEYLLEAGYNIEDKEIKIFNDKD